MTRRRSVIRRCTAAPASHSRSDQIVGVYRDVRNGGPGGDAFPEIDVPFAQSPWTGSSVAVRTAAEPGRIQKSLAAVVRSLDPDLPMTDVKTMDQSVDEALAGNRFNAVLFGTFAGVALLLAAVGIYGVMAWFVQQHTRDIGIRLAIGGDPAQVRRMIVFQGVRLVVAGIAIGVGAALLASRLMSNVLFGVSPTDPRVLVGVPVALLAVAIVACLIPAQRAAGLDPAEVLRDV
jgi:ABC-type antimicrobial peptide transport system permease subunit